LLEIAQPRVQETESGLNYGRFVIEPLEPGYGITIGNALRRILLRSLPGIAITRVHIDDVWHEFSAIQGVREDVTEVVLNLKRVRLRAITEDFVEARASLYFQGSGEVTAGDIDWPGELEIVNPDLIIAHLDGDDSRVEMDLVVSQGRGYQPAENQEIYTIGEIPVDSIFTPIEKVNYVVEHTRVGQITDYDRLIIEIITDGTVEPADALSQAAQILVTYGRLIADFNRDGEPEADEKAKAAPEVDNRPLAELGLSPRVLNALRSRQIERVGQVLSYDEDFLLSIRNFGPQSLKELREALSTHGYLTDGDGEADEATEDDVAEDAASEDGDNEENEETEA
jgi:DNA-directed RNA polymerase subunit alpha